jgi:hypothetical protein
MDARITKFVMTALVAAAVLFAIAHARAADFSAKILDLYGQPMVDDAKCPLDQAGNRKCDDPATLGIVAMRALLAPYQGEENLSGEDKFKRFALAMKIKGGGEVPLSAEDTALLKKLIGKLYTPLVVGRAFPLLDPAEKVTGNDPPTKTR